MPDTEPETEPETNPETKETQNGSTDRRLPTGLTRFCYGRIVTGHVISMSSVQSTH